MNKLLTGFFVSLCLLGLIGSPIFSGILPPDLMDAPPSYHTAPMGLTATLLYPHIGHAAILLNGSKLEIQVRGPNNISSWNFELYREYQTYTLAYDTPSYNVSTSTWHVNVTIPVSAKWDLYDLQVTVSDGLNQVFLEEWNAVQVRHWFSENFTIVHLTDTHFFPTHGDYVNMLRAAQHQALMANADLIINTGDLTDDGELGSYILIREIMRESRVPYFVLTGNHDRDDTGTYANYKSFFHTDYYTANLGPDVFIIMANAHQPDAPNYRFNWTQLAWIERDLAASTAQTKIVCSHSPLIEPDSDEYFLPEAEALELQRLCDEYNVTTYLAGHRHNDRVDLINDTYYILTTAIGGSVWEDPDDPGHHRHGFRILDFEIYNLTSWSWKNWNWSLPWDEVKINRYPNNFHIQERGAYISIINNLSTPLTDQLVDFLLEPLTGPTIYKITGASIVTTLNVTSSWFIRVAVDIPINGVAIVRIFTSNAVAPTINSITYPNPGIVGTVGQIVANITSSTSWVHMAQVNISFDSSPYVIFNMGRISDDLFRYYRFLSFSGTVDFSVIGFDCSGLTTTSPSYQGVVTAQPSSPILADPGDLSETGNITLGWTASIDVDGTIDHYTAQVSDVIDFGTILAEETSLTTSALIEGLTNGTYHFRVRSVDNDGAASNWSNIENTTVAIPAPPPPPPTTSPPPILPSQYLMIAAAVGAVVLVVIVIIYFVRFRKPKSE